MSGGQIAPIVSPLNYSGDYSTRLFSPQVPLICPIDSPHVQNNNNQIRTGGGVHDSSLTPTREGHSPES